MAINSNLIHSAGDLNYDEVFQAGRCTVAKYNADLSAITGNNFLDGLKMPPVALVHFMIDVVAPASATPQLWCKFYHRWGRNAAPNDAHAMAATHEDTSLASRFDLDVAELAGANNLQTIVVLPTITEEANGGLPLIWHKEAQFVQLVSVDAGDTGELNITTIITDMTDHVWGN